MKAKLFTLFFTLCLGAAFAQTVTVVKVCNLPAELSETSGLLRIGPNRFLTHNDSGSEPLIYMFDSSGTILRRIRITNATNTDWEDMALDNLGNVYIGDFGNNANDRKDLKIYKISNPNNLSKDSTTAAITTFVYSDQNAFPPAAARQNFDMEAMVWYRDSLYLFSKDRSNPYTGYIKQYKLSSKTGFFIAQLTDSFRTCTDGYLTCSATAASVAGNKLFLSGYDKCWLFDASQNYKFLRTPAKTYLYPGITQREGVFFENENRIWYTQENSPFGAQALYRMQLPQISTGTATAEMKRYFKHYPVPAQDVLKVELSDEWPEPVARLEIYDMQAKLCVQTEIELGLVNEINIQALKAGRYFIHLNGQPAGDFTKEK